VTGQREHEARVTEQKRECARFLRDDLYRLRDAPDDESAPGGAYDCKTKWVYANPLNSLFVVLEILRERSLTGTILGADNGPRAITTGADAWWLNEHLP
jgi:hypothetical protein